MKKFCAIAVLFIGIKSQVFSQYSVVWSTYFGGTATEIGNGTAADAAGNIYLCGFTSSTSGVAAGGFQNTYGGGTNDAFLAKYNSAGTLLWATYYGGTGIDYGQSVAVDASGNVYLAGNTGSTSGIASGGFQNTFGGGADDAFLVKFNSSGARLWATYYGGSGSESAPLLDVCTDAAGNIFLTGHTNSPSNIASGGFQNTFGGGIFDGFLVKFNSAGARLWGTYYGGTGIDYANSVATDPSGNVFIGGNTNSTASIASGGFQNTYGGGTNDAFVVKFDASGARLWGTYYGGSSGDVGKEQLAADVNGNVFLHGSTMSTTNIASAGAYQTVFAGGTNDAFLVKFDPAGNRSWATYYGDAGDDMSHGIATDASGSVFIAGHTGSTANITSGGYQNTYGGGNTDAWLVKFDANGTRQCATYLGGTLEDDAWSLSADLSGNIFMAGHTKSPNGIALNGNQNSLFGTIDAYVAKVAVCNNVLSLTVSNTNLLCNGVCNGTATSNAVGGGSPYTYLWSDGQTTQTATALCAGVYTVTVTDAFGTTAAQTVTLTQPPPLTMPATQNNNLCNGQCVGDALVIVNGGTPPYLYQWSSGQTTPGITNLCAGNYTLSVTDTNGCLDTLTITITEPSAILLFLSGTDNLNCISPNGTTTANASGGTPGYTYLWSPSGQTTQTATGLTTGTYTVTVTDFNGCTQSQTVSINGPVLPSASAIVTNVSCNGGNDGSATVTASSGTPPYSYLWSNSQTGLTANNLSSGIYTVTITDMNGCSITTMANISQPNVITTSTTSMNADCNQSNGQASVSVNGGTPGYFYLWNNAQTTSTSTGLSSGTYTVTITDANNCTVTSTVSVGSNSGLAVNISNDTTIVTGSSAQLNASGGNNYTWSPSTGLSCITCPNPVAAPSQTTIYCVIVSDASGCMDSACVKVFVEFPCGEIFVPTAFSPDGIGDSRNNLECIYGRCIQTLYFSIFNRWGEKVFETNDLKKCWDGNYKGEKMNTGVYAFYLKATLTTGEQVEKKGNVSLIR